MKTNLLEEAQQLPFEERIELGGAIWDSVAEVPELPGCVADGATYEQAVANVQVIIAEWIETAKELGRPIPEPRGRLMFA